MSFKDTPDDDCMAFWHAEIEDVKPLKKNTHKSPQQPPQKTSKSLFEDPVEEDISFDNSIPKTTTSSILHENFIEKLESAWNTTQAPKRATQTDAKPPKNIILHHNSADIISGSANGIDQRTLKKLAAGQIPFTDRLDLHGFYETQAWAAVQDFLHEAYSHEHRCVLIIHGKGKGYGDSNNMGIIKSQIANWLTNHPRVLAFHTAHKKDGGRGAIYVYLRRPK